MELTTCPDPDCATPAEVLDRWVLASTGGPAVHVRTLCLRRHVFTALVPAVPAPSAPVTLRPAADRTERHRR
jgi:hypothetical protein